MSGGLKGAGSLGLGNAFRDTAKPANSCGQKAASLTIRVSAAEKAQLEAEAGGASLSAVVRERVFSKKRRRGYSIADQVALSRLLRALAQSHLALDLEAICAASEAGEMPVGPALQDRLEQACDDVAAMRRDLIRALGLKSQ
jgi:hypothetical protein